MLEAFELEFKKKYAHLLLAHILAQANFAVFKNHSGSVCNFTGQRMGLPSVHALLPGVRLISHHSSNLPDE